MQHKIIKTIPWTPCDSSEASCSEVSLADMEETFLFEEIESDLWIAKI